MKKRVLFLTLLFLRVYSIENEGDNWINLILHSKLPLDWIDTCNQHGVLAQKEKSMTHINRPIFNYFPQLSNYHPCIACADLPTPITYASNISSRFPLKLYIKRDDLTGPYDQGSRTFGGNKVRKLEFLLGEAKKHGAQDIITFGCVGSNHAVATAVHAKRAGFHPICMLKPQPNSAVVRRNLLLHLHNGTELHTFENVFSRSLGSLFTWLDIRFNKGVAPYLIPTGGSNPVGVLGFVNAALELNEQIKHGNMPKPDVMYVACGSIGTAAGLLLGCKVAKLKTKIVAVPVEPEYEPGHFFDRITELARKTMLLLQKADPLIAYTFDEGDLEVKSDFAGEKYGLFTEEAVQAIGLVKEHEQIQLDGTYSGKAFACLVRDAEKGILRDKTVLYWNTYCGLDFDQAVKGAQYQKLPEALHRFFEEDLQPLDR